MTLADALGLSGAKALARSVRGDKRRVLTFSEPIARALEQAGHVSLLTRPEELPPSERADAICLAELPSDLRECARALVPGGAVLIATGMATARRERHLITAALLHAGLVDIEQRWSRGVLMSTGRVRR